MVGSAIIRCLENNNYKNIIKRDRKSLNLIDQEETKSFFESEKPEIVIIAAAKVGGILANSSLQAEFLYENLSIQNNIIHYAHLHKVKKLIFLGSACIYPKLSTQPIKEDMLLTGPLEPTNEGYAIAKISGIKMCQYYYELYNHNFISLMPNNLYGQNDNFDLESSHVLPALMRKFHEAKISGKPKVEIWGSGKALREFLHVDDLAAAVLFALENIDASKISSMGKTHINVGSGEEVSIKQLANILKEITNYEGKMYFNKTKPDGTPKKLLDCSIINNLGWSAKISLSEGIENLYYWYKNRS